MESGKDKRSRSAFFENPAALFPHSSFLSSLQAEKLSKLRYCWVKTRK